VGILGRKKRWDIGLCGKSNRKGGNRVNLDDSALMCMLTWKKKDRVLNRL
jgi:hypothetical protein